MIEGVVGETQDTEGNRVVLLARVWREKILRDHPELTAHETSVLRTVAAPDLVEQDPSRASRRRFYLKGVGPSRWLMVVVTFVQRPARIITAFGLRKDPRSWKA